MGNVANEFKFYAGMLDRVDRWLCWEKLQMVGFKKNLKILQMW